MKTNDLKKGTRVALACGWKATLMDNMRGNTRLAKVEGFVTELGSVYSHDIVAYQDDIGMWHDDIELTTSQKLCQQSVKSFFA